MNNENIKSENNTSAIAQIKGTPARRRRRSKSKRSKFKHYLEMIIWGIVIAGFLYVIYLLLVSSGLNVGDSKKKADASKSNYSTGILA